MQFRNVLVFSDGQPRSERALRVGARLARRSGGRLAILHVAGGGRIRDPLLGEALGALQVEQVEKLRALAAELGVEADAELRTGRAFEEIIRKVLRDGCDLVVKSARGRERSGWPLLGSTAQHLVRKCPVPVWLVGDDGEAEPRRVLALLAGGPASDERTALDRRVLEVACSLGTASGARVRVAAAWDAPGAGLLAGRVPAAEIEAWVEGERRDAEDALGKALQGFEGRIHPAHVDLVRGVAERELVALAERHADLVVLGTSPPEGGAGLLIREEAEDVINRLDRSVVAVKPEGFVSPVSV
jgi:nucleotide-binding universal stress UspA family protein